MSDEQLRSEQSDSNGVERDRRAAVVVELLRMGHSPAAVSRALRVADAGGSVYDAMEALREDRHS